MFRRIGDDHLIPSPFFTGENGSSQSCGISRITSARRTPTSATPGTTRVSKIATLQPAPQIGIAHHDQTMGSRQRADSLRDRRQSAQVAQTGRAGRQKPDFVCRQSPCSIRFRREKTALRDTRQACNEIPFGGKPAIACLRATGPFEIMLETQALGAVLPVLRSGIRLWSETMRNLVRTSAANLPDLGPSSG